MFATRGKSGKKKKNDCGVRLIQMPTIDSQKRQLPKKVTFGR